MFTGIIQQCGTILASKGNTHEWILQIATPFEDLQIGESIAIDGVCLTVTRLDKNPPSPATSAAQASVISCDVSPETLSLTTLGLLREGSKVNMERALRVGDRLGGHCVTGHVDQMCVLASSTSEEKFVLMRFMGIDLQAIQQVIQKGSIAVNGVSLTVNEVIRELNVQGEGQFGFEVMLIPQTLKETNLAELQIGDKVNIEFDMLVKVINNRLNLSSPQLNSSMVQLMQDMISPFISIEQALAELQQGRMIILVDNELRENEGDLLVAAEKITAEHINFMVTHGRGLVCVATSGEILDRCHIPLMTARNTSRFQSPFTVSIDAVQGISTGISAADRACTIQRLLDLQSGPEDFVMPGHVFPLRAHAEGVLGREGHTEGGVELAKLAGLKPASVICEIMNEDGSMARLPDLTLFARQYGLSLVSMQDIVAWVRNRK